MSRSVYQHLQQARRSGRKLMALLIDPDKLDQPGLQLLVQEAQNGGVDLIFVGGSLLTGDALHSCLEQVRSRCSIPVVLFPGSLLQISEAADALLFLSLISGRNPDLLIGNQVIAAPYLKEMDLEILSTGYMLVESGRPTTASYMSNSQPIPHNKPEIAACTAMAGEMLGLKLIYLDGGSGAVHPVSEKMVAQVRASVDLPIIVGGGIRHPETARSICRAGADVVVVGNATESQPELIPSIAEAIHNG